MNSRGAVIAGCTLVALIGVLVVARQAAPVVAYEALTDGLQAILWLVAAAGWGAPAVWRVSGVRTVALRIVLSIAAGIGVLSIAILLLGLAGWMNAITAWAMLAIGWGFVVGGIVFWARVRDHSLVRGWLRERAVFSWSWVIVMPMLSVAVVAAVAPPGVLWGDEPNGYDVVEYHLQVPREWYEAGRISGLEHNVYSYLPMGVEMHYLLAMHLRGGPWKGMYLAQFMHAAMIAFSVVVAASVAREATGQDRAGVIAALSMCCAPWLMLLAPVAYNEGGLLLFGTSAIGLAYLAASHERKNTRGTWALTGAMAGFACGVKLTAAPMLVVAIPLAMLVARARNLSNTLVTRIAFFVISAGVVASPWLVRNLAWARNPVFPEATSLLGRAHFSEVQAERWRRAHSPPERLQPIAARFVEAKDQILLDWRFGYALLPMALIAIALRRAADAWFLAGVLVIMFITWIGFTHLQSRFFVLAIPVAALAIARVERVPSVFVSGFLVLTLIAGLVRFALTYSTDAAGNPQLLANVIDAGAMGIDRLDALAGVDLSDVSADRVVALVGDARAFVYSRPMSKLRYRTVFDVNASSDGSWIDAWLSGSSKSMDPVVVVDPNELRRFSKTYWQIPPPPPEIAAKSAPYVLRR